jgi:hypothetical protein
MPALNPAMGRALLALLLALVPIAGPAQGLLGDL